MNTYLFAVPIAPGKTELWKKYVKEMTGPRFEEYKESRRRSGVKIERVYLQQTPHGDMCVVLLGGDNPQKSLETFAKSDEPFDRWFREKILIEAHGLDLFQPFPENESMVDFQEVPIRDYVATKGNR